MKVGEEDQYESKRYIWMKNKYKKIYIKKWEKKIVSKKIYHL